MAKLRLALVFCAGLLAGAVLTFAVLRRGVEPTAERVEPSVCYSCFWQGYDAKLHTDLIEYYKGYNNRDPLVLADSRYILWRATGIPNCDIRRDYSEVERTDADPQRRYLASAVLAFGAAECGVDNTAHFQAAADSAEKVGLTVEAKLLREMASHRFRPQIQPTTAAVKLTAPGGTRAFVLGRSRIEITDRTVVGSQVDRVMRDWISYQLRWDLNKGEASVIPIHYHEGAFLNLISDGVPAHIIPLAGSFAVREGNKWYAADDAGVFRYEILPDKIIYPTTHVDRDTAFIEDTHGISALVPQAIEQHVDVVVGCGDSVGKMAAAYDLAVKGVNVIFPGDRYEDELLGYTAKGTLIGGAPVRTEAKKVIVGDQPVEFSATEPIVVEDSKALFPLQYYDAPARYFRRLNTALKLPVTYVEVDNADQIERVLQTARAKKASAVAVRVFTEGEYMHLREWLQASARNRAILFHSGLYPFAQKLFGEFREQVTFGDLHPEFIH